jgi:hypothetical protein
MRVYNRRDQEGVALVTATIFIAAALIVLGALSARAIMQSQHVDHYSDFKNAFQGLEAAYAQSKAAVEDGEDGNIGLGAWTASFSESGEVALPDFEDANVSPQQMGSMPRVRFMAYPQPWGTDNIDNNGDGVVDGPEETFFYTVYALSQSGSTTRRAEIVMEGRDVNVWRNAIFAGAGQAGGLINGNVSIHGSVHLLGTQLLQGDMAIAAIDLSGTSMIHNNYSNCPADLLQRVPTLPLTTFNGEEIQTLNAKLRVKSGLVSMSGNSEVGEIDLTGNAHKETVDGTFVNDGWTGTSVTDDGGRGDPTHVWSDNGWDTTYDLGDKVPFPWLTDDWRDVVTGDVVYSDALGRNYTHAEYFGEVLADAPYPGDMQIKASQDFYYNASRPADLDPTHRLPTDDYILFNATTNHMEVNGQIEVNGSLNITRGGGVDKTIHYSGRAALLVNGDVTLDTDLLTVNADGTTANSFPQNNILGIMASQNMTVGSLSQLSLMGAFYAQQQINCSKQSTVMGTFVSNYFNMGTNVPSIFQVPDLADNLPLGMIGAYPILVFSKVSWRELGV